MGKRAGVALSMRRGVGLLVGLAFVAAGGAAFSKEASRCKPPAALRQFEQVARDSEFTFLSANLEEQEYSDVRQAYLSARKKILSIAYGYNRRGGDECVRRTVREIDGHYARGAKSGASTSSYLGIDMVELDALFHVDGRYMALLGERSDMLFPVNDDGSPDLKRPGSWWYMSFNRNDARSAYLTFYALCRSDKQKLLSSVKSDRDLKEHFLSIFDGDASGGVESGVRKIILNDEALKSCRREIM